MTLRAANRPLYGLLLAGGESRRMGFDKASLQRGAVTQLEYLMEVLEQQVDRVFLSTRSQQKGDTLRDKYHQIVDGYHDIGPIAGVLSAFDAYTEVDWLVVACDLPNVSGATLANLIEQRSADAAALPFTAYSSSRDGLPEPLCAIYSAGSDKILRDFVEQGLHCPRKMLIRSETQLLDQPDPSSLDNVNTPEDLQSSVLRVAR